MEAHLQQADESASARGGARLFRLLGLHPGASFSTESAASLAGARIDQVRKQLGRLIEAGMITQTRPSRYVIRHSIRAPLAEQARRNAAEADQAQARLISYYLHTSDWLARTLAPYDSYDLDIKVPEGVTPRPFDLPGTALDWWQDEHVSIVSVVGMAAEAGLYGLAWRMSAVLRAVYAQRNEVGDWWEVAAIGAASAMADGDSAGQALAAESLGQLHMRLGRREEAETCHHRALQIRHPGDRYGEARTLNDLGLVNLRMRKFADARTCFEDSAGLFADLDMPRWIAVARANDAEVLIELGRPADAAWILTETAELFARLGDLPSEGNALFLLSQAQRAQGDLAAAQTSIHAALAIAAQARNLMWRWYWLLELGRIQRAEERYGDALATFEQAAAFYHQFGDRSREALAGYESGETCRANGRAEQAITFLQAVEPVLEELDDRWHQARCLISMAKALEHLRHFPQARTRWEQALAVLTRFEDPMAAKLRREIELALDRLGAGERDD